MHCHNRKSKHRILDTKDNIFPSNVEYQMSTKLFDIFMSAHGPAFIGLRTNGTVINQIQYKMIRQLNTT